MGGEPDPELRLVCFPHSGGSAGSFAPWAHALGSGTQLLAVQYPGRADRFREAPATSVKEVSRCVAEELRRSDDTPTLLFGHSLGALIAYETALRMGEAGTAPELLAVSSSAPPLAPPLYAGGSGPPTVSDEELWSVVQKLGGTTAEIAENDEWAAMLIEIIRSDIAMNERYRPAPDAGSLSCQVRCYHGIGDSLVDERLLAQWEEVSTGRFSVHRREGGHFHAFVDPSSLINDLFNAMTWSHS